MTFGDATAQFDKVRFLPSGREPLCEGVLYVCGHVPDALPEGTDCAFALTAPPSAAHRHSCLVVESSADEAALFNLIAETVDALDAAVIEAGELAWRDGGISDIVELLAKLVGNPVYIVDSSFKVLAITHDPDMEEMSVNWMHAAQHGYLSYDIISGLIRSNELHDIESSNRASMVNSEYFYTPFANYNLRQDGRVQGHLFVVQMYRTITPGDLELIDAIAPLTLRATQLDKTFQARRGPLYENFVIDWLEGNLSDPAYISRQLDALDFDATACSVVAVIRLSAEGEFRREHLAHLIEDRQGCRAVSHEGRVIALFQIKHPKEKASVLKRVHEICKKQQCQAFVSDVQEDFFDTPRGYRQALIAMRIRDALGLPDELVQYGNVSVYQLYLNFSSPKELDAFCHPAIIALLEHDRTHAAKLLPTLSAYLKHERDVQATADELFVHRNTLTYRIRRILELCPVDLDDFPTRHRLLESILIAENYAGLVGNLEPERKDACM